MKNYVVDFVKNNNVANRGQFDGDKNAIHWNFRTSSFL